MQGEYQVIDSTDQYDNDDDTDGARPDDIVLASTDLMDDSRDESGADHAA
jgi:hypothetical protein